MKNNLEILRAYVLFVVILVIFTITLDFISGYTYHPYYLPTMKQYCVKLQGEINR